MKINKKRKSEVRFKGFTDAWEQRRLGEVFKYEQPQNYIVESTEYDDKNEIPVLTAGQSFILGYTDERFGIKEASKENPVIIFDDFTTSSHYVDFPFKVKSSAMKLLTLNNKNDNIHCAYNVMQGIDYVPTNHERHWISIFSNFDVLMPSSSDEQQKIGEYFSNLDQLITLHQRKYDKLVNMKKSMLEKMFPQGDSNVPEIRFKEFTGAWEHRKVSEVAEIVAGGTPSTSISEYWEPKEIPWLSSGEVHKKYISYTDDMISKLGLSNSSAKMIKENSVLIALAGQGKTRGTVAINRISLSTNQSIAAMTFNNDIVPEFIFSNLENRYDEIRAMSSGDGSRGGLNKQLVGDIVIPYTIKEEQTKIGDYFTNLDSLIALYQCKLEKLKNIKSSMLEKMFVKGE